MLSSGILEPAAQWLLHLGKMNYGICTANQNSSVFGFRLDLELGQDKTRQTAMITGQPPHWQHQCRRFWEALENSPLSLTHVPPAPFILPPQEKMLPFCVLSEPFLLSAGHREPGKSQRGRCTSLWVSPKEGGSRAQADPRPHCPPRWPGGVPGCCGGAGGLRA